MATVFSSSDGDGEVLASMLAALAQPQVVLSPTLFHNSVFNAPAGYWSIGVGALATSITVSAGAASFVAGLKEAHSQVLRYRRGGAVYRLRRAVSCRIGVVCAQCRRSPARSACALRLRRTPISSDGHPRLPTGNAQRRRPRLPLQNCWRDSPATRLRLRCRCCEPLHTGGATRLGASLSRRVEPLARLPAMTADRARIEALIPQQGRDVPARRRGFLGRATYHLLHHATPCCDQSAAHGQWTFVIARHRIRGAGDGRAWRADGAGRGGGRSVGLLLSARDCRVLLFAAGRHRGTARSSKPRKWATMTQTRLYGFKVTAHGDALVEGRATVLIRDGSGP